MTKLTRRYAGLPVAEFSPFGKPSAEALAAPSTHAWFVRSGFENDPFEEVFARFLDEVDTGGIEALLIGFWGTTDREYPPDVPEILADAAPALPALRSLLLGDIETEEAELSWIRHHDVTPVLEAFPGLERFEIRGSLCLELEAVEHTALRTLRFESGGLPAEVVQAVVASDLPNLTHLAIWFGSENYGGDATVEDVAPLLSGERVPALRHLGLENSEEQDEIAAAVAGSPVLARLESLALGMGTLTDTGAEALLAGQPLTHLKKLDLGHHFLSEPMMERLRMALPDTEVLLDGALKRDDDFTFVQVSE